MTSSWQKFEELIKQDMRKRYSEAVVEHSMDPRNLGELEDANECTETRFFKDHRAEIVLTKSLVK
jgi:hypothetical protein